MIARQPDGGMDMERKNNECREGGLTGQTDGYRQIDRRVQTDRQIDRRVQTDRHVDIKVHSINRL